MINILYADKKYEFLFLRPPDYRISWGDLRLSIWNVLVFAERWCTFFVAGLIQIILNNYENSFVII